MRIGIRTPSIASKFVSPASLDFRALLTVATHWHGYL